MLELNNCHQHADPGEDGDERDEEVERSVFMRRQKARRAA